MKKYICIFFIVFVLVLVPVSARAGGGHSSGGSRGGSTRRHYGHATSASPISTIVAVVSGIGISVFSMTKIIKKRIESKKALDEASAYDLFWVEDELIEKVKDSYFAIQNAWTHQDLTTLSYYLTQDLYEKWKSKITFQQLRNEKNVLENIQLLNKSIIEVHDDLDNTKDYFWVMIKGKMKDSIEQNGEVISVDYESFKEYWKFVRYGNRILLDEVLQEDEMDLIG